MAFHFIPVCFHSFGAEKSSVSPLMQWDMADSCVLSCLRGPAAQAPARNTAPLPWGRDKDVLLSGMRSGSRRNWWRRRANSGPAVEGDGKGAATVKSAYSIKVRFPKNKFLIGNLVSVVCDETSWMLFQMHTVWLSYVLRQRQAVVSSIKIRGGPKRITFRGASAGANWPQAHVVTSTWQNRRP
jgi:hypothetical protein